ncbi:hypothetical protein Plhal304r1_c009g0037111 [Plasmopara halstedii]
MKMTTGVKVAEQTSTDFTNQTTNLIANAKERCQRTQVDDDIRLVKLRCKSAGETPTTFKLAMKQTSSLVSFLHGRKMSGCW